MSNAETRTDSAGGGAASPRWRPLGKIDRRVLAVLVEKAKTTPEAYPMSVNGLINGCNQKSNRDPQMQLEEADVVESLDRLKQLGAVAEIQGSGRVAKFRHLLYEWMGVDKVELAVMAELLLRGAQTEGELRGRASRMEPIADLNTLRSILDSLRAKKLVIDLTPPGRGQILTHGLYEPDELDRLKDKHRHDGDAERSHSSAERTDVVAHTAAPAASRASEDLQSLRAEVAELRRDLQALAATIRRQEEQIEDLRSSLGG